MSQRAFAILTLALSVVLANPSVGQEPPTQQLQARIDALALQISLRGRQEPARLRPLRESVQSVLTEWNDATRGGSESTDADRRLLNDWLDAAFPRVMPGGSGRLPETPTFPRPEPAIAAEQGKALPQPTLATAVAPPLAGPVVTDTKRSAPKAEANRTTAVGPERPRSRFTRPRHSAEPAMTRAAAKPIVRDESSTVTPPPERRSSKWSRHPAAAPLEWHDPFVDDQAASQNPIQTGARREARRPLLETSASTRVNLTQLAAEVRGYNAALRELQTRVMRLDDGDVFALADSADELDRLEEARQFLDLYREGLSATERRRLPDSPSPELVRELVRRRAADLTRRTPPDRQAERRVLERLNDRLARFGHQAAASY